MSEFMRPEFPDPAEPSPQREEEVAEEAPLEAWMEVFRNYLPVELYAALEEAECTEPEEALGFFATLQLDHRSAITPEKLDGIIDEIVMILTEEGLLEG